MPFILPSGEQIQIDFFNVTKGTTIVAEYLYDGILLVKQSMPAATATVYASALLHRIQGIHMTAANEHITFEILSNEPRILISVNSFATRIGSTHMEIDYLLNNKIVLSQRTSIETVKAIAEIMKQ